MGIFRTERRNPYKIYDISFTEQQKDAVCLKKIHTSSEFKINDDILDVTFLKTKNENDAYIISFELENELLCSGASVELTLDNWDSISYLAFGLMDDQEYKHVKVAHCRQEHKFILEFSIFDLAWKIQNDYKSVNKFQSKLIKVFIKGNPNNSAKLTIDSLYVFEENNLPAFNLNFTDGYKPIEYFHLYWNKDILNNEKVQKVRDVLLRYDKRSYPSYHENADFYLSGKGIALAKYTQTEVGIQRDIYKFIQNNTTLRYSFHSQNQANTLLMLHESIESYPAIFAARDMTNDWINNHYVKKTDDMKYCWYDHGTAERLMTFVRLFVLSSDMEADLRYMTKLITIIFEHAQLLSSEVFYARDQNYRYHNHGLFQDIALLSTSLILESFELADEWKKVAIERMIDQFEHLIYTEEDYAVLKENSPGYHAGTVRMVEFIVSMLEAAGDEKNYKLFSDLYQKMNNFTDIIRYPGGRIPAIGDTFRMSNTKELAERSRKFSQKVGFYALDEAGYAIANGQDNEVDFKFILTATNLNKTHKHDDHLSFILFFDGIEWLVDPSFYSHQYTDPIPAYLRSAAAHNVMYIPDQKFSNELSLAHIKSEQSDEVFKINGYHEAYQDIKIIREVEGSLDKLSLSFKDIITSDKDVDAKVVFQCGESVVPERIKEGVLLTSALSDKKLLIVLPEESNINIINGQDEPYYGGWLGVGFSEVIQSCTIEIDMNLSKEINYNIELKE